MNNLRGIMKQKTMGSGVQAKPAPGMSSFMNQPDPSAPMPMGGLLKKKKAVPEIKPLPNLMKRLTGK